VSDPCKVSGAEEITVSHKKMLQSADVILCASVPVMNTTKQYLEEGRHLKVHLFEDGFSTRLIDLAKQEFKELNLQVRDAAKPLVAYIGGVNNKIWWDAVSAMAAAFPDVNFVFVGPKEYDKLPCAGFGENVTWLPPFKEYSQLGYFLKRCKAGLIPYTPTRYVAEMRPAKINEYLVMGLPIVSVKMPEVERLAEENGPGIVYLADTAETFVSILRLALDEDCQEYRIKRWQITQRRSWETVCREIEIKLHGLI